ncbi:phage/plasmid primase, P4 family [Trichocoleus desertorum AS-A10]|uniref:DNA primase family protein n=1 Tax=Trichocoleus desertorum TaxID=1481672 RepID=UPI003299CB5A
MVLPQPSLIATELREKYNKQLAWNVNSQSWYSYSTSHKGVWSIEPHELIQRMIQAELDSKPVTATRYGSSYVSSILNLLKAYLAIRTWDEQTELIPLLNGVLDVDKKQLLPHSPTYLFTWCLPYEYDPIATCEPIQAWLLEAMNGEQSIVELLRAYLNTIILSRVDLQRYLECIGPGGTGKSTYTRLAVALVGRRNTFTTELKQLEQNRFESAAIYGKRLVLITDSERYGGQVSKLKALTGQDLIRYERKNQQQGDGFASQAMVLIAANEAIQSNDYTSGLQRRRLSVPFTHVPETPRDLLSLTDGNPSGEFAPYLPGLLNWVLEMPKEQVTKLIVNAESSVPRLAAMKAKMLCDTNPIADWVDHRVIHKPETKTYVGDKNLDKSKYLYSNYVSYCHSMRKNPVAGNRFSSLLEDLCRHQLKLAGVEKARDRNGAHFVNLKLREPDDSELSPITRQLFSDGTVTEG